MTTTTEWRERAARLVPELPGVAGELLVLRGDHQHGATDAGVGQGREGGVDQAVGADGHQGLVAGGGGRGLLRGEGAGALLAHAGAESPGQDHCGVDHRHAPRR